MITIKKFVNVNMYNFNETKHVHTLDDKPLTGTTTVLRILNKPFLLPWAVGLACDEVEDYILSELDEKTSDFVIIKNLITHVIPAARTAHLKKRDLGGAQGTAIHADIENYIKYHISHERIRKEPEMLTKQGLLFREWAESSVDRFLFSELCVYSKEYWLGGIIDFGYVGKDGKKYIGDIKTSKGIYPEHFWQMAGYQLQLAENNGGFSEKGEMIYESDDKPFEGRTVVNLPKAGGITVETSYGWEDDLSAFLACLTIYRKQEKLNNALGK